METHPETVTLSIAILTLFLSFITSLKYTVQNNFVRTRLVMTTFFLFIITTLSVSFWNYALMTFPYSAPSALLGAALGQLIGVQTEKNKIRSKGLQHYMNHFAHVHLRDFKNLTWWTFVNFYSIMGGLALINLVGLSTVIFHNSPLWAILTSTAGAFLLGTLIPYIIHLWSIRAPANRS